MNEDDMQLTLVMYLILSHFKTMMSEYMSNVHGCRAPPSILSNVANRQADRNTGQQTNQYATKDISYLSDIIILVHLPYCKQDQFCCCSCVLDNCMCKVLCMNKLYVIFIEALNCVCAEVCRCL